MFCTAADAEAMLRGVSVRLRDGVVHIGVGFRLVPAENSEGGPLKCLTDKAGRSGEKPKERPEGSLTGVRSGVRMGDEVGI